MIEKPEPLQIGERVICNGKEATIIGLAQGDYVKVRYDSLFRFTEWEWAFQARRILEGE